MPHPLYSWEGVIKVEDADHTNRDDYLDPFAISVLTPNLTVMGEQIKNYTHMHVYEYIHI